MKKFKTLVKELNLIRGIITIITVCIFDGCIIVFLDVTGYFQWLGELIKDTLTIYEDLSFFKYIKVMGMDMLGVISCFGILYCMFSLVPYVIADIMGLNAKKAGDT